MLRIIFSLIVIVHGLIHLLGFVKEFNLAKVEQLTGKTLFTFSGTTVKIIGCLWLVSCVLLVGSAIFYLLKNDWWWIVGIVSLLLSQILIILYWSDAKFGTIANIILLLVIIPAFGTWKFNLIVNDELSDFLKPSTSQEQLITSGQINNFPRLCRSG